MKASEAAEISARSAKWAKPTNDKTLDDRAGEYADHLLAIAHKAATRGHYHAWGYVDADVLYQTKKLLEQLGYRVVSGLRIRPYLVVNW